MFVSFEMLTSLREVSSLFIKLWSQSRQLSHSVVTQTMSIYPGSHPINTPGADHVVSFFTSYQYSWCGLSGQILHMLTILLVRTMWLVSSHCSFLKIDHSLLRPFDRILNIIIPAILGCCICTRYLREQFSCVISNRFVPNYEYNNHSEEPEYCKLNVFAFQSLLMENREDNLVASN